MFRQCQNAGSHSIYSRWLNPVLGYTKMHKTWPPGNFFLRPHEPAPPLPWVTAWIPSTPLHRPSWHILLAFATCFRLGEAQSLTFFKAIADIKNQDHFHLFSTLVQPTDHWLPSLPFAQIQSNTSRHSSQALQSSTPEWYTTPIWYTFVYFIASPNHNRFSSNKISWLHVHTNKSSTKFQVNWTSSGYTVKCSKVDVLQTLLEMLSPPNDTPVFCKFLDNNTKESSEIWRDGSHWLTESYYVVFMGKTYCSELKIEFNDFTILLRGGWL